MMTGNDIIFEAERERNKLEIELSDLKGLARLTKKKELENRIAIKTEEIRTFKAGLSGIVKQHGFATVQDFYTAFYTAQRANDAYEKECAKALWHISLSPFCLLLTMHSP